MRFAETDAMGIVHHSRYLPYLEEARVAYLRHIGHPYTLWREQGSTPPCSRSSCATARPLRFDDVVDVHLLLAAVTPHDVPDGLPPDTSTATRAATAVTVHGTVTADGRPTRLPAWLVAMGAS